MADLNNTFDKIVDENQQMEIDAPGFRTPCCKGRFVLTGARFSKEGVDDKNLTIDFVYQGIECKGCGKSYMEKDG